MASSAGRQARGPDGAETRPLDAAAVGDEDNFSPFIYGRCLIVREGAPKANHIASIDPKGKGRAASSPWYRLVMSCGNYILVYTKTNHL